MGRVSIPAIAVVSLVCCALPGATVVRGEDVGEHGTCRLRARVPGPLSAAEIDVAWKRQADGTYELTRTFRLGGERVTYAYSARLADRQLSAASTQPNGERTRVRYCFLGNERVLGRFEILDAAGEPLALVYEYGRVAEALEPTVGELVARFESQWGREEVDPFRYAPSEKTARSWIEESPEVRALIARGGETARAMGARFAAKPALPDSVLAAYAYAIEKTGDRDVAPMLRTFLAESDRARTHPWAVSLTAQAVRALSGR